MINMLFEELIVQNVEARKSQVINLFARKGATEGTLLCTIGSLVRALSN